LQAEKKTIAKLEKTKSKRTRTKHSLSGYRM